MAKDTHRGAQTHKAKSIRKQRELDS